MMKRGSECVCIFEEGHSREKHGRYRGAGLDAS